jgi:hypothetical protein
VTVSVVSSGVQFSFTINDPDLIARLDRIEQGVTQLSKESTAATAALTAFQALFSSFAADATKALNDIAATGVVDPADKTTLINVATGLGAVATTLADLDAKIKAADPGAVPVGALPFVGPTTLPQGVAGQVYAPGTFTASGGAGGNSFAATGLPGGLALSTAGVLTGTPTAAGSSTVVVTVTDSAGTKVSSPAIPLSIAAAVVPGP